MQLIGDQNFQGTETRKRKNVMEQAILFLNPTSLIVRAHDKNQI